jgi:hypothetical protein
MYTIWRAQRAPVNEFLWLLNESDASEVSKISVHLSKIFNTKYSYNRNLFTSVWNSIITRVNSEVTRCDTLLWNALWPVLWSDLLNTKLKKEWECAFKWGYTCFSNAFSEFLCGIHVHSLQIQIHFSIFYRLFGTEQLVTEMAINISLRSWTWKSN